MNCSFYYLFLSTGTHKMLLRQGGCSIVLCLGILGIAYHLRKSILYTRTVVKTVVSSHCLTLHCLFCLMAGYYIHYTPRNCKNYIIICRHTLHKKNPYVVHISYCKIKYSINSPPQT